MAAAKARAGDVLIESLSPFPARLNTQWFYCEQQPSPMKTVRYVVKAKPVPMDPEEEVILGHIGWKGPCRAYAFFPFATGVWEHRALAELAEILDYLSKRQRRSAAPGRREA